MKIVAVLYSVQTSGLGNKPRKIRENPLMTIRGMKRILSLIAAIKEQGPFQGAYCSHQVGAAITASILATGLDINFQMAKELGQCGDNKAAVAENDMVSWQKTGLAAISVLYNEALRLSGFSNEIRTPEYRIIVVGHRLIISG